MRTILLLFGEQFLQDLEVSCCFRAESLLAMYNLLARSKNTLTQTILLSQWKNPLRPYHDYELGHSERTSLTELPDGSQNNTSGHHFLPRVQACGTKNQKQLFSHFLKVSEQEFGKVSSLNLVSHFFLWNCFYKIALRLKFMGLEKFFVLLFLRMTKHL